MTAGTESQPIEIYWFKLTESFQKTSGGEEGWRVAGTWKHLKSDEGDVKALANKWESEEKWGAWEAFFFLNIYIYTKAWTPSQHLPRKRNSSKEATMHRLHLPALFIDPAAVACPSELLLLLSCRSWGRPSWTFTHQMCFFFFFPAFSFLLPYT